MHIVITVYIVYVHSYMRVIAYRKWARGGQGIHTHTHTHTHTQEMGKRRRGYPN